MAGASHTMPRAALTEGLSALGLRGEVDIEADLLAMFHSGTNRTSGCVLVGGTGCVAARISDSRLELVSDGTGWLLGDAGSGYWIGHMAARAVVAALDGRGPETDLTRLMLKALHLNASPERIHGRPSVLLDVIDALYRLRPIELARFAPLVFEAGFDPVAAGIVTSAASAMADTLKAVRGQQGQGPVVVGGSVAAAVLSAPPPLGGPLRNALENAEVIRVNDGLIGAAVLGLRRAGVRIDEVVFRRLQESVGHWRARAAHGQNGHTKEEG
jgi:N-acetylglucosamine kinase-like BadF-type ATPase